MGKENRWTLGIVNQVVPKLQESMKGRHGCFVSKATFDTSVGEEALLAT
jgi:hypothetical protein